MAEEEFRSNALQRFNVRLASSRPGAWFFARAMHHVDRALNPLSGGRWTVPGLLAGLPTVMLTTTGARSGAQRTTPVIGVPYRGGFILIASNWGQKQHPGWYYNLRKEPACVVSLCGEAKRFRARQVTGEERASCWQRAVAAYAGFEAYRKRTDRDIGVFVLEPDEGNRTTF
jgi:deazaflavin-dependent oxidoreductase (nitroreductase family)